LTKTAFWAIVLARLFVENPHKLEEVMANGRDRNGVRSAGQPKLLTPTALVIDAHGTLVVPKDGIPQSYLAKQQAEAVLGPISISHQKLAARIDALRLKLEERLPVEERSGRAYWGLVNRDILSRWGCTAEKAVEISRRLTTNVDLYDMPDDRRGFFVWLLEHALSKADCKAYILSNSDFPSVSALLQKIGMSQYFPEERICTPEMFGGYGKPANFRNFAEKWKIDPERALMVGNSGFHDVPAAAAGMHVLWFRSTDAAVSRRWLAQRYGRETLRRIHTVKGADQARKLVETYFDCSY
jgi:FMN phosphatase YigB (HAD superfamily)